ncbi:MAG: helix-turn-helix transcriptional regulator [Deltaproteobacteria bacterium]|nr:helix-turn-helix transcriptional regulator [Myxococcales bacterium]MDP3221271.1 helix-turn-helix transcriptional regulator [Deltaproteobacteria bacterium]
MSRLRGNGFANIRAWTVERHGSAGWSAVLDALDPHERAALVDLRPSDWYPLSLQARLLREIDRRFGDDDLRLPRSIGADQAARDLDRGVLTWLFRLFPPAILVGNMDVVWRRFHDNGRWRAHVDGARTVMVVSGWNNADAANCADVEGYLEFIGRRMSRVPGTMQHTRCRLRGHDGCEFVYSEPLERRAALPRGLPGAEEVAAIGRELMQIGEPGAVLEAIETALRYVLPRGADAALWGWEDASGHARLLWSCGRPTDRPAHCVVLESAGRTVARLDLDAIPEAGRAEVLAALEGLAPWFGTAMAASHAAGARAGASGPTDDGGRVVRAAATWRLTPRQGEVLRGVISGRTNKEIAAAVGCAEATVEVHMTALFRKSGVSTRSGLVRAALGG